MKNKQYIYNFEQQTNYLCSANRQLMYYKIISLFCISGFVVLTACNNHPEKSTAAQHKIQTTAISVDTSDNADADTVLTLDKDNQEAVYKPAVITGFKTAYNQSFNFSFELPNQWRAIDESTIGDGYYVFTGKKFTDIRIYGERITPDNERVLAEVDSTVFNKIETFIFNDGIKGLKLSGRQYRMFVKDAGRIRVSLYIKARKRWLDQNEVYLEHIAHSIKPIRTTKK